MLAYWHLESSYVACKYLGTWFWPQINKVTTPLFLLELPSLNPSSPLLSFLSTPPTPTMLCKKQQRYFFHFSLVRFCPLGSPYHFVVFLLKILEIKSVKVQLYCTIKSLCTKIVLSIFAAFNVLLLHSSLIGSSPI